MKIVLASQSPRRKELLGRMGLEFVTQASKIDESAFDGLEARELVATLSREKAQWIARQLDGETLVIGADTVVVRDGAALGKPKDAEDAVAMLLSLSGRDHQVCTGVTVCRGDRVLTQVEEAQVTFRDLTEAEVRQYVSTGEPMDKAGAYGIQGLGGLLVEGIRGDYSNVVGLPVCRLGQMLKDFGVDCLALAGELARRLCLPGAGGGCRERSVSPYLVQNIGRGSVSEPGRRGSGSRPFWDGSFSAGAAGDGVTAFFTPFFGGGGETSAGEGGFERDTGPERRAGCLGEAGGRPGKNGPDGGAGPGGECPLTSLARPAQGGAAFDACFGLGHCPDAGQLAGGSDAGPGEGAEGCRGAVRHRRERGLGGPGEGGREALGGGDAGL